MDGAPSAARTASFSESTASRNTSGNPAKRACAGRRQQHHGIGDPRGFRVDDLQDPKRTDEALADIVTTKMHKIDGIEGTETLIAFRAYSRHDLEGVFSIGMK